MGVRAASFETALGPVTLEHEDGAVTGLRFGLSPAPPPSDALALEVQRQVCQYLAGRRRAFDLPVRPRGTAFQLAVWREIDSIPYGGRRTYGQLALALGRPGAARAVGGACGKNPIWLLTPCHRVVASHGLGGYEGGAELKEKLLRLEEHTLDTEKRAALAAEYKAKGYNCAQAVLAAFPEIAGDKAEALRALASGFAVGMGTMETTCGALIGAVMLAGLGSEGRGTVQTARAMYRDFEERCGATICRELKGRDTGKPLCPCPECVKNAVRVLSAAIDL